MDYEFSRKQALYLRKEGQKFQEEGDLGRAIDLYTQSIAVYPTPESYNCRGFAYSTIGRIQDAIDECKKAISVDPGYGESYFDIGSYLMSQGKPEEAEEWFHKAKSAARYEERHQPCIALGRIYASRGHLIQAIDLFNEALVYCPGEQICLTTIQYLKKILN